MESLVFKTQSERNIGKQRRSRSCGNYLNFGCTDFTCRYIQISAHESGRDDFQRRLQARAAVFKGGSHSVFKSGIYFTYFDLPEQCWKVPLYRM